MRDALHGPGGRIPHVLFGVVVALLALLAAWWFVFLGHAVRTEDRLWHRAVRMEARALELALPSGARPGPLNVEGGARFDVRVRADGGLEVVPSPAMLADHEEAMRRLKLMIRGEGALLLLLVLGCTLMLYRLVLSERRYRRDADQFLSRVTHEMKTPLAGLRVLLETLRDGRIPPERLPEIAELGLRQAEREEHLIENLLTAQRLATDAMRLELAEIDLAALLRDFVAHRRTTMGAEADGLALTCPEWLPAQGHAGALQTILENLADNAFKYGARRLRLEARSDGGTPLVVVEDDGQGFDPAASAELFQPFRRGAGSRGAGRHGTGLGLPIALALAEEMGGSLKASSDGPGRGARFELRLRGARAA